MFALPMLSLHAADPVQGGDFLCDVHANMVLCDVVSFRIMHSGWFAVPNFPGPQKHTSPYCLIVIECRLKPTVSTYPESSPPGTAAWFGTTSALILWTWAGNHARDSISLALLLLFCLCKAKKPCSGCPSNPLRCSSVCGELTNYTLQILLQIAPSYSGNCCIMVAAHSLSPLLSLVVKLSLFTGLRL